jgi:type II secretory pathway component GspD/PulD (secretin)
MVPHGTRMATVAIAVALTCVAWGEAPEPSPTNRFVAAGDASAPAPQRSKITPDFRDVDFSVIAEAVGQSIGRSIVIGPGVCASVSAAWETELTAVEFYQAFVSIARTLGFTVVEQGSVTTVTLDESARKGSPQSCRRYPV